MVQKCSVLSCLYHRKCHRRVVGGQKSQNLVNVVCGPPLILSCFSHYHLSPPFERFSGHVKVMQSKCSHQAVLRQPSGSLQTVVGQTSNCKRSVRFAIYLLPMGLKRFWVLFFMKFVVCFYLAKAVLSRKARKFWNFFLQILIIPTIVLVFGH